MCQNNIKVETFWDQLLHYPGSILYQSKTVYTVYTPFWKNWIQQPKADIAKTPDTLQGLSNEQLELVKKIGAIKLPTLQELGFIWDKPLLLSPGEKAAQERLDFWLSCFSCDKPYLSFAKVKSGKAFNDSLV